jgi:hypothetical protein
MKIKIPADYFYKGSPEQTLEVSKDILKINPKTAWDEHIKKEIERVEKINDDETKNG